MERPHALIISLPLVLNLSSQASGLSSTLHHHQAEASRNKTDQRRDEVFDSSEAGVREKLLLWDQGSFGMLGAETSQGMRYLLRVCASLLPSREACLPPTSPVPPAALTLCLPRAASTAFLELFEKAGGATRQSWPPLSHSSSQQRCCHGQAMEQPRCGSRNHELSPI